MFRTLNEITSNGFCMGCGLCTGLVPDVGMDETEDGMMIAVAKRALTGVEHSLITRLCPGVSLTAPVRDGDDPVWGTPQRVAEGWSGDPDERFRASAGGVMTAINRYLLESGRADFILQVRAGGKDAMSSEPVFIRDPAELLDGSQSRYAPCAPLTAIHAALDTGERFAVSLKPCDIAGVENLRREDSRVSRQVVFTQAMFCGTVPSRDSSNELFRRRGIDPVTDTPLSFRWRGNGCPGPTVAEMPDGRTVTATYNELWNDNPWTTSFRCKICPDAVGLHTDLATGDFWENAEPLGESPGENGIIAHTPLAREILQACEAEGRLVLSDIPIDDLNKTQPHHQRLRQSWAARVAGANVAGAPMPDFRNLSAAVGQLSTDALAETFQGALERARKAAFTGCQPFDDWGSGGT